MEALFVTVLLLTVLWLLFLCFCHWLRYRVRVFAHRERMAAIEKGVDVPMSPPEFLTRNPMLRPVLLLMGLIWICLAIPVYVGTHIAVVAQEHDAQVQRQEEMALPAGYQDRPGDRGPKRHYDEVPLPGLEWLALTPVLIGLSHVVVYAVAGRGKKATRVE